MHDFQLILSNVLDKMPSIHNIETKNGFWEGDRLPALSAITQRGYPSMYRIFGVFSIVFVMTVSSLAFSPAAHAQASQPCVEEARQVIERNRDEVWEDVMEQEREHTEPLLEQLPNVNNISACVTLQWPSIGVTLPSMEAIIRGLARRLYRMACEAARNAMRGAIPTLPSMPNFPSIPSAIPANGMLDQSNPYLPDGGVGWDAIKDLFESPGGNPGAGVPVPTDAASPEGVIFQ